MHDGDRPITEHARRRAEEPVNRRDVVGTWVGSHDTDRGPTVGRDNLDTPAARANIGMPPGEALVLLGLRNLDHACPVETSSKGPSEAGRHVLRDDQSSVDLIMQVPEQGNQRPWTSGRGADDDDLARHPLEHRGLPFAALRFGNLGVERQATKGRPANRQR